MRRVRLLCWRLYRGTPLDLPIDEHAEQVAAARCKLSWAEYLALKAEHPQLWEKWAAKRQQARAEGWSAQPEQLKRWRCKGAPAKSRAQRRSAGELPGYRGLNQEMKELFWAMQALGC